MTNPKPFRILSDLCALGTIALGIAVMWAWYSGNSLVLQIKPEYPTMKFNTALGFVLCGVAMLSVDWRRPMISTAASGALILLGFVTIVEFAFGINLHVDTLFVYPTIGTSVFSPGRMAPNTAITFVLAGTGLFLSVVSDRRQSSLAVIALTGSMVTVLGAVPSLGYLCGVEAAYLWGDFTHMAMHTAFLFVLIGICIVGHAWDKSNSEALWLPIPIGFGLIIVAFLMSQAVRTQEEGKFVTEMQSRANHAAASIHQQLGDLYLAVDRIAYRWHAAGGTPQALWQDDAQAYLNGYPYLAGLSKTDADSRIQWLATRTNDTSSIGFRLNSEPIRARAISDVIASHTPHTTPPLTLLTGQKGFLYVNPLYSADHLDGFLVAVFRIDELFKNALSQEDREQVYYTIMQGEHVLFSTAPDDWSAPDRLQKSAIVQNRDSTWSLTLSPTPALLALRSSVVPLVVLCIGLTMAFLVSICTFLALKGQTKNKILQIREAALESSSRLNTAILSSTGYIVVAIDVNGIVLLFNSQAERSLGYSAAEIIGRATPTIWHDKAELAARAKELSHEFHEEVEPGLDVFTKIPLLRGSEDSEWTFVRKDGTRFPVILSVTPLHGETQVDGFLGVIRDITEQKEMELALKESEETFRMAMEHASIGMALVNVKGGWHKVNRSLCQLLGYSEAELLKTNFQDLTYEDDLQTNLELARKVLAGELETYSMEKRYVHKDGRIIWTFLNVSLVRNKDDKPEYFIAQIQDITERKEMERIKSEFISVVSHELRTPLTSIRGSLGLVVAGVAGALPEKSKELLTIAHKNSERLVLLINDILDLEKMESGKISLRMQQQQLIPLLKEAIETNQPYADKFKVRYKLEHTSETIDVVVDSHRIMQVLANLMSNAAKFSPANADVLIRATHLDGKVTVHIQDFGAGIPKEFQTRIFGKFAQADASNTRRYEGTGLGLSIAKQLVELMGGEIGFRTEAGRGTTFFFTLAEAASHVPLQTAAPLSAPEALAKNLPRVLHVEDDADLSRILTESLRNNADIVSATTIREAKEYLLRNAFDLVVLDLSLPDGSGIDLLEDLEKMAGRKPPVLILSVREVPPDLQQRVAGALVKLRVSETKVAGTILSMLNAKTSHGGH